ncbi:ATP-binding protein [Candidatus Gottesmanbacteria bacterium]|nr:ATP-binding protein [Candidatus Gottesmanbacteria bacterium]
MINLPFLKAKPNGEPSPAQTLAKGMVTVGDIIAPGAIEVDFNFLKIGNIFYRTLFVAGYPRFVSANWLEPLISFDHSLEVSTFIYPTESKEVLENLKRKIGEMEATIQSDIKRGRVIEPSVQVALEDALALQQQLAKGAERFFQFGLYITIPAESLEELEQVSKQVEATLGSLLIISKKATLQMEEGFKSSLPICSDKLMITRNMDTTSLATTFPFTTSELTANEGILYGINEHNDSLVIFDRFSLENANSVVFGKSIAGWENILIRQNNQVRVEKIGSLIEKLISQHGITYKDEALEGVQNPNFETLSYNKTLRAEWAKVNLAARKPFGKREKLYRITTKSGRKITVTADHSLVVLRNGHLKSVRGQAVKIGEAIPLCRKINEPDRPPQDIFPRELVPNWPLTLPHKLPLNDALLTLLGLTTSEGLINEKILRIFNTDPEVLEIISTSAEKIGAKPTPLFETGGTIDGFSLIPKSFAELFFSLGTGGKSGEKRIPPFIFSLSNKQVAFYLRAYFEGDGTVSKNKPEVSCCSKSQELISDLAYLFLRFGIIARIHKKFKKAINSKHSGDHYYDLTISGVANLKIFSENIGFLTSGKNRRLTDQLSKSENTNVDVIPTLEPIFKKLYSRLYLGDDIKGPVNLSPLKRGVFSPSKEQLKEIVRAIENRISELRQLKTKVKFLNQLPQIEVLIEKGSKNRKLNHLLWRELGHSWQLMKKRQVRPGTINVLRAYKTITGETVALPEVKQVLYETFQTVGISLRKENESLWSSVKLEARHLGDVSYPTVLEAVKHLKKRYRSLQLTIRHAEREIRQLKKLTEAELFWDPIATIEQIKHQEKYVYDLTVDNQIFLAGFGGLFVHNSGGGKSYLVKLEALRSLMFGTEIIVIDPEAEYEELSKAVGGEYISFSFNAPAKINPFDLSGVYEEGENELGLKILSLHGLCKVIMGQLSPTEEAILDRALVLTYKQKGITPEPATQKLEPPLLEDLYKTLIGMEDPEAKSMADRLEKFIKGSLAGIFNQPSNVNISNPFTVFSLKELEDELRPIAMYIILDYIWTRIKKEMRKRILVVDEAWYLMRYPDSATFLYSIAKRARKYFLGLTTITQDVEDFLGSDYGKAIVQNSSIQILLKQSPAAIDKVAEVFYLSQGEKNLLLSAEIGKGLFFAGPAHVAVRVVASEEEHQLATTKPEELLARKTPKTPAEEREKETTPKPTAPAPTAPIK